jgi:hypothetical protein
MIIALLYIVDYLLLYNNALTHIDGQGYFLLETEKDIEKALLL